MLNKYTENYKEDQITFNNTLLNCVKANVHTNIYKEIK
jgi:hypothetical protein